MGLDNPLHIAFLLVILLLVFGARRLPEIGRSLGSGMREFKDSISGGDSHKGSLSASTEQQAPAHAPAAQAPATPAPATGAPAPAPTPEPAPAATPNREPTPDPAAPPAPEPQLRP